MDDTHAYRSAAQTDCRCAIKRRASPENHDKVLFAGSDLEFIEGVSIEMRMANCREI